MISNIEPTGGKSTGKNPRIKIAAPKIATREEAETVLHEIAVAANDKRAATAAMDAELLEVKSRHQAKLTECDQRIDAAGERLATWATDHPEIFPKDRKSVAWNAGKFGFRTDTPSLAPLKKTFGWAKILAVIAAKRLRRFVRIKTEVDKDAILARCGTLEKPTKFQEKTLPLIGLKIVQDERFFVEPDLTKAEVQS